jgi:2-oxoglutarate ferredoxin oxidoreductase subunit delta
VAKVSFLEERCKGCGLCIAFCPKNCLALGGHLNTQGYHPATLVDGENCISCAICARMCPDVVIEVEKEARR